MPVTKDSISSPLEAGPSILDVQNLPTQLNSALEYTSSRLARKSLHITLVVIKRDYQLPTTPPLFCASPDPSMSPPATPASSRLAFAAAPVAALKQLVRTGSQSSQHSASSSGLPSPAWPRTPATPGSPPPMTPSTVSSALTDPAGPMTPNPFGIRLIYANTLSPKEERTLHHIIEKAEKRFRIGSDWLPQVVSPSFFGLTDPIIRRSIVQNDVLFSSEGLTLLSLDRLYSFKSALASYSRTGSPLRLEDAVDELRRLVLSRDPGKLVPKADVIRSYEWLSITDSALRDADRMYRRAYGGVGRLGAIEGIRAERVVQRLPIFEDLRSRWYNQEEDIIDDEVQVGINEAEVIKAPPRMERTPRPIEATKPEPAATEKEEKEEPAKDEEQTSDELSTGLIRISLMPDAMPGLVRPVPIKTTAISTPKASPRASPVKGPALKLQTTFPARKPVGSGESALKSPSGGDDEEEEQLTARPVARAPLLPLWSPGGMSIAEVMMSAHPDRRGSLGTQLGPMTPNGYEDISPITRGEWGFLMVQPDGWGGGRRVAVETC